MGDVMGGLRGFGFADDVAPPTTFTSEVYRWRIWRDPACDYVDVWVLFDTNYGGTWTAQAGGGAVVSQNLGVGLALRQSYQIFRCPWGVADSNYQNVTVTSPVLPNPAKMIRAYACIDVPRRQLDAGDNGPEVLDVAFPAVGLAEGRAIAISNKAGPDGLVEVVRDTWDDHRKHALIWSTDRQRARQVFPPGAFTWTPVFATLCTFLHRARARRGAEVERYYTAYADVQNSIGGWTGVQITTSRGVFAAWANIPAATWTVIQVVDLKIACQIDDTILVEVTGGAGSRVDVAYVSIGEAVIPDV
jgi:hypothetical protein